MTEIEQVPKHWSLLYMLQLIKCRKF